MYRELEMLKYAPNNNITGYSPFYNIVCDWFIKQSLLDH